MNTGIYLTAVSVARDLLTTSVSTHPMYPKIDKLAEIMWHDIKEPGAYIEIETGHLYRIPEDALGLGSSPLIRKETSEPCQLVRISKDPFIPKIQARVVCYNHGLRPRF